MNNKFSMDRNIQFRIKCLEEAIAKIEVAINRNDIEWLHLCNSARTTNKNLLPVLVKPQSPLFKEAEDINSILMELDLSIPKTDKAEDSEEEL